MLRGFPDITLYKWAHIETRSDSKMTPKREEGKGKRRTWGRTERRQYPRLRIGDSG